MFVYNNVSLTIAQSPYRAERLLYPGHLSGGGYSSAVIMIVNVIQQVGPIRDMPDSSVRVAVVKPRSDQTSALQHRNDRQGEQKRSRSLALMVPIMKPSP